MPANLKFVVLSLMFLVACGSCASPQLPDGVVRHQKIQGTYAVKVARSCNGKLLGAGSGVLVGPHHVLTANHVVDCDGDKVTLEVTASGTTYVATVDRRWADRDIARLKLVGTVHAPRPVVVAPQTHGAVCGAVQWPTPGITCGVVKAAFATKCFDSADKDKIADDWCYNVRFSAKVAQGNSGGGLYNMHGQLVGLVTGAQFLPGTTHWFQYSYATELWPIRDELFAD